MTKMEKIKANFREFVQAKTTKVIVAASLAAPMLAASASAVGEDTGTTATIDSAAITAAFTSGFNDIVVNSIAMISAMVPIALTLAGCVFLVKKGMNWFKGVAK